MGRSRPGWLAVIGVAACLTFASAANAASVSNVSLQLYKCPGCVPVSNGVAGDGNGWRLSFTAVNGLSNGNQITVTGPEGIQFQTFGVFQFEYGSTGYSMPTRSVSNGGRTITMTVANLSNPVPNGGAVSVSMGATSDNHINPTSAGFKTFTVQTTNATDPATGTFNVVPAAPSQLTPVVSDMNTTVGTAFPGAPSVRLEDQYGNDIAGSQITFDAPATGASGTFPGPVSSAQVSTDANGLATAPALAANTVAGQWNLAASGPNSTAANLQLTNDPGAPDAVSLELEPDTIVADSVSTSQATATVTDEFGNAIPDETVAIAEAGDAATVTDVGDGTYTASLGPSLTPGVVEIQASVPGTPTPITDSEDLTYSADTTGPAVVITKAPDERTRASKPAFKFASDAPDLKGFKCSLDDGRFRTCESGDKFKVEKGRHVFKVIALDWAGNAGPEAKAKFKRV